jgi:hypothetical protein
MGAFTETSRKTNFRFPFPFSANKRKFAVTVFYYKKNKWKLRFHSEFRRQFAEYQKWGDMNMETWRHHRHGDMETWRNGDMDTWTWTWRHEDNKQKRKPRQFSFILYYV